MIRIHQIKLPLKHSEEEIRKSIQKTLRIGKEEQFSYTIIKKSLDARKKPDIYVIYSADVVLEKEKEVLKRIKSNQVLLVSDQQYIFPHKITGAIQENERPVIIGFGPAGMFCGYMLASNGYRPIILERGFDVDKRMEDVSLFWEKGILNPESNVQFGEGGAGTFSDGKLNTLVNDKSGRNKKVLSLFAEAGAPEEILYDYMPHIGTDILCKVVKNIRTQIIKMGGEIRFGAKASDFILKENEVQGVIVNEKEVIESKYVVLAIGHSARDTFECMNEKGIPMTHKEFAVGLRVGHPQKMINEIQYGKENQGKLPSASYKLTAALPNGRRVYSFCMCPGGYIVDSSSEPGQTAVNGMSYHSRSGVMANSAIIVNVTSQDLGGADALAGVRFQRELEKRAYSVGEGRIPVTTLGEFKKNVRMYDSQGTDADDNRCSINKETENISCQDAIKGRWQYAPLHEVMPQALNEAFLEGMEQFNRQIPGFAADEVLLAGIESRTSSPVRILRNENLESEVTGLYPCGEGAGYAGGITSAAMDGIKVAEKIAFSINNKRT